MVATKVCIYPAFNARYYSTYVLGLRDLFGRSALQYSTKGFPEFGPDCLAFRLEGGITRRVYIHSNDMPELDAVGLEWSDAFGKVNLDHDLVPDRHRSKVFALGPMFPVRVWDRGAAELRSLANYLPAREAIGSFQAHVANYRGQYRSRFDEHEYSPGESDPGYLFFNAAIWERESRANAVRSRFVQAAMRIETLEFEGGLTPRHSLNGNEVFDTSEFAPFISKRFSAREYLEKTKRSVAVLNNPAYRDCHSWRLAEGLALGKAIVSTPIVRALPSPLEHGVHVHYVSGSTDSLEKAIRQIRADDDYRHKLESNARHYYESNLAPATVMRRLLENARFPLPKLPQPA